MRATEFISEVKLGKIGKRKQVATRGLHTFKDNKHDDRTYELNRVMMAVAAADANTVPTIDSESWAGKKNVSAPYTKQEQDMLINAYKAIGSAYNDINGGDLRSQEVDGVVNKRSPVAAFKGYK